MSRKSVCIVKDGRRRIVSDNDPYIDAQEVRVKVRNIAEQEESEEEREKVQSEFHMETLDHYLVFLTLRKDLYCLLVVLVPVQLIHSF